MDNYNKLLTIFSELFSVPATSLSDESTKETVEGWDSMGTVNLVAELEGAFQISFDLLEVGEFNSIGAVKEIMANKGVQFD